MRTIKYDIVHDETYGTLSRVVIDGKVEVRARWLKEVIDVLKLNKDERTELTRQIRLSTSYTKARIFD